MSPNLITFKPIFLRAQFLFSLFTSSSLIVNLLPSVNCLSTPSIRVSTWPTCSSTYLSSVNLLINIFVNLRQPHKTPSTYLSTLSTCLSTHRSAHQSLSNFNLFVNLVNLLDLLVNPINLLVNYISAISAELSYKGKIIKFEQSRRSIGKFFFVTSFCLCFQHCPEILT